MGAFKIAEVLQSFWKLTVGERDGQPTEPTFPLLLRAAVSGDNRHDKFHNRHRLEAQEGILQSTSRLRSQADLAGKHIRASPPFGDQHAGLDLSFARPRQH